ncbi:hypothetical protein G6011_11179 [Alternaria panax]|uniref:Uncharacterized protein n=1 Tax=Alternaria panax TaxID=48097 RepID=A0AAD4NT28_9PLEO|nr:hypothetical protein G6011_11179 [Alternaria panax]
MYPDHLPVLSDEIYGDPTNPQNMINGKKTRKGSSLYESRPSKATHATESENDETAKASTGEPFAKPASPAKTPATSRTEKGCAPEEDSAYLTPKDRGGRGARSHNKEDNANSFEAETSPGDIRWGRSSSRQTLPANR